MGSMARHGRAPGMSHQGCGWTPVTPGPTPATTSSNATLTRNRTSQGPTMSFFFPAEDGIRDADVTGVQTCALPISLRKGNRKALVSTFREMKRQSKNEQLGANVKGVKAPTLLMWGELDTWVPLDVMEQFRHNLEDVKLVTYEGVGHMPMEEIPVQTARDAHYFIETGRPFMPAASVE